MRSPARKAAWWFVGALLGAAMATAAFTLFGREQQALQLAFAGAGMTLVPVGLVLGITAALSGLGAWRLSRGVGMIARWQVQPPAWEAFRAFTARRAAEPAALANEFKPRPATAPVEVRFGRHQVIVDGSYHPLRRYSVPELGGLGWLQPPDAPECIEFHLVHPRGRYGGTVRLAVRVPVAPEQRADAVRVFEHFRAMLPTVRIGLAQRRPWLVIGWGAGVTAFAALVGAIAWLMLEGGDQRPAVMITSIGGLMFAIGGALFTAIVALVALPGRRRDPRP